MDYEFDSAPTGEAAQQVSARERAGRFLAWLGGAYLVLGMIPGLTLLATLFGLATGTARSTQGLGALASIPMGMLLTVAVAVAVVAVFGVAFLVAFIHFACGRAVRQGGRNAATVAFVVVTIELGAWLLLAGGAVYGIPGNPSAGFHLPTTPVSFVPLAMPLVLTALLYRLSAARREEESASPIDPEDDQTSSPRLVGPTHVLRKTAA